MLGRFFSFCRLYYNTRSQFFQGKLLIGNRLVGIVRALLIAAMEIVFAVRMIFTAILLVAILVTLVLVLIVLLLLRLLRLLLGLLALLFFLGSGVLGLLFGSKEFFIHTSRAVLLFFTVVVMSVMSVKTAVFVVLSVGFLCVSAGGRRMILIVFHIDDRDPFCSAKCGDLIIRDLFQPPWRSGLIEYWRLCGAFRKRCQARYKALKDVEW